MSISRTFRGHTEGVTVLALIPLTLQVRSVTRSHNAKLLVTTSHDKTIKLWATSNFNFQCLRTIAAQPNVVWKCDFSPDDNYFMSVSWGSIKIWDPATGKCLKSMEEHKNWVK
jgi:WD40 repeat protein